MKLFHIHFWTKFETRNETDDCFFYCRKCRCGIVEVRCNDWTWEPDTSKDCWLDEREKESYKNSKAIK